jgi:gliding motility-associated protein GldC
MKKEQITFDIELDDNNVPEKLHWTATQNKKNAEAKAIIISVWDAAEQSAMRIDLWNKEMQVDEMKQFVHQTILTLADSFERATNEHAMAATMRDFCEYYAEKMKIQSPL